jgi:serine/threonine-protein kinase
MASFLNDFRECEEMNLSNICMWCAILAGLFISPAMLAQQSGAQPQQSAPAPDAHAVEEREAQREALGFLQYLDQGRYADSYSYTSAIIRAKMNAAQFEQEIKKDRAPLGAKQTRKLLNATYATSLPTAPAGQYVVLQYNTDFAKKKDAVETVTMSYENGYWRLAGWFLGQEQPPPQQQQPQQ